MESITPTTIPASVPPKTEVPRGMPSLAPGSPRSRRLRKSGVHPKFVSALMGHSKVNLAMDM
jgi:hypothetical protein